MTEEDSALNSCECLVIMHTYGLVCEEGGWGGEKKEEKRSGERREDLYAIIARHFFFFFFFSHRHTKTSKEQTDRLNATGRLCLCSRTFGSTQQVVWIHARNRFEPMQGSGQNMKRGTSHLLLDLTLYTGLQEVPHAYLEQVGREAGQKTLFLLFLVHGFHA